MKYDVIVIGGGIGGLTAGALLVRRGLRVLLLEQGKKTGGYVTSFKRGDFTFDATGAFLGGCEEGGTFHEILVQAGALQYLRFLRIDTARNMYPDFSLDLHLRGGFEEYVRGVRTLFPEEQRGLKEYFALLAKIGKEIDRFDKISWPQKILFPFYFRHLIRYQRASLGAVMDRYFQGDGIKLVLSTLPAHLPPSRLSFLFTATLLSKVLADGVWYPQGGMGMISQALETAFVERGGEIRLQTEAEKIAVAGNRVQGVIARTGEVFSAPRVVSAINISHTVFRLLPEECRGRRFKAVHELEYSLSSFLVYVGVKMDLERRAFPYFTYVSPRDPQGEYRQLSRWVTIPDDPTMIITIPTLLDPSLAPPGHHIVRLMTPAVYDGWGLNERQGYRKIKEETAQRLIRMAEDRYMPGLSNNCAVMEAATPHTLERYTANEGGATYGLAPTPRQFGMGRPANRTSVKGLYLAGHYTRPSHGIVGAALSGRFVADMISREQRG